MKCYCTTYHKLWYLLFPITLLLFGNVQAQVEYHSSRTNEVEDRSSITVSKPTGVQAGDFLFVAIASSRGSDVKGVKPPDDGWILVEKTDAGSNFGVISFYKFAGPSEPSSYEFKFYRDEAMTQSRSGTYVIGISRFSGVHPTNPFQAVAENAATSRSRNVIAPSVTTTLDDSYVLVLFGIDQEDGFESSSTFFRLYDKESDKIVVDGMNSVNGVLDDDDDDVSLMLGWFFQENAGATGTRTAVADDGSGWWAAQTLALREVGSAPEGGSYTSNDPEQEGDGTAQAPFLFTYGTPIGPLSPIFDGGDAPTTYTISSSTACALPTGLSMSATTGVISGTPVITVTGCAITVVAANDFGNTTITVYITVVPRPLTVGGDFTANDKLYDGNRSATFATNNLQLVNVYNSDDVQLTNIIIEFDDAEVVDVDQPVRITSASLTGTKASFYTLSLVGAPTTEAMITTLNPPVGGRYVSDDPNQTGDGTESKAFIFTVGQNIGNLDPIFSGGGAPTGFEISDETACPLPAGLSLNPTTGVITGTPLTVIELCAVTVIASNDDGNTTITVYITVIPAAVPGGSVSGMVFEDSDASATKEGSEVGVEGITVRLYSGSTLLTSTTTDEDGNYLFADIPVGTYTLNIVLPTDFYESLPGPDIGGNYTLVVASEQVLNDYDFGIFEPAGVFGFVTRAGGSKIAAVMALESDLPPGITISGVRTGPAPQKTSTILNSGNQVLISSFTTEIDENGYYEVHNLVPGQYSISVEVPAPWVVTSTNPVDAFLAERIMIEVDFDITEEEVQRDESVIMGYVSASDAVALQAKLGTDVPKVMLEGIKVELSGKSTAGETITRTTFTDEDGMYSFTDLPSGNYVVEIKPVKAYSYDWPMHQKHAVRLGNSAETGGKMGQESSITTVDPNVDTGMAIVSLLIDTNLDGKGDRRVDLTTEWYMELKGLPTQQVRSLGLESMGGLGYNSDATRLNGLLMRATAGGTLEKLNATDARVSFSSGFILEHNESYLMVEENLQWTGISKTWPIREQIFTLNRPVNVRDPFGRLMGRILSAELRPMYGVDFNLEYADFGDADQTYGTLRAKVSDQAEVHSGHIFYPRDGARHLLPLNGVPQLYLGSGVLVDLDGLPSVLANRSTDDDGLILPDSTAQADTARVSITLMGSGLLSAWVDWNQNGFFDAEEIVWRDVAVSADPEGLAQTVSFVVPETALVGTTRMRVRLTTQAGVGPNGLAWNGEVEDYLFVVTKKAEEDDGDDGGGPTSDPRDGTVPGSYRLGNSYPNPFNPTTVIPFELAQTGAVKIEIYDMSGRRIQTILDRVMSAGSHNISFNAAGIPSGVYVVRMAAGGQVFTGKVTLVK